jgi:threonine dehydrogenase-like Zn-dependent dehydrogenase
MAGLGLTAIPPDAYSDILKGEYPVAKGLTIDHEPVGVIEKLGSAVQGYTEGQRVIAGAICPTFTSSLARMAVI